METKESCQLRSKVDREVKSTEESGTQGDGLTEASSKTEESGQPRSPIDRGVGSTEELGRPRSLFD